VHRSFVRLAEIRNYFDVFLVNNNNNRNCNCNRNRNRNRNRKKEKLLVQQQRP